METDRNDYNKKQNKYELESTISKLLNRMGITASIKGYHFIRKGVMMVIENREAILSITKGLYPDIAKEYKEEENLNYVNKYNLSLELLESKYQKIIHSEIGALVVKEKYNFDDDICNAIKYHTIGNVNMNMLAKIIFIADKIGRENLSSEYKQVQELAYKNIDEALKLYFLLNNKKLENKGIKPHPNSIELLNFLESE